MGQQKESGQMRREQLSNKYTIAELREKMIEIENNPENKASTFGISIYKKSAEKKLHELSMAIQVKLRRESENK